MIVLLIGYGFELSEGVILLAVVDEGVGATWSQDLVGLATAEHGRCGVFPQETSEVNRVDDPILIAL